MFATNTVKKIYEIYGLYIILLNVTYFWLTCMPMHSLWIQVNFNDTQTCPLVPPSSNEVLKLYTSNPIYNW